MLCCACLLACLIFRVVKKKDFFSFSEKCGWYNLSPFVVNVVKRNCLTLDCSRVSVCTPMCFVCVRMVVRLPEVNSEANEDWGR